GLVDSTAAHHATDNPAVGAFIYRTNDGTGAFNAYLTKLRWNYADIGAASTDTIEIRLFGIEMVYVPQGAFYAGDGWSTAANRLTQGSSDTDPWYITSENTIAVSNVASNGYYYISAGAGAGEFATGAAFSIPLAFPKGFGGFYIMKGEISQGQWVAFFNTLTATQKTALDITSATGKNTQSILSRNTVSWTGGDATNVDQGGGATHASVAMNYLNLDDVLAYLDWAGLRPMSELEYEKAVRGPLAPVALEYAWGDTTTVAATSITDSGLNTERAQSGSNVACGTILDGPVRVGSFAKGVATRQESGAGYYGAMDLSGNVYERAINISRNVSLAFKGYAHGDGLISSAGVTDESGWPATRDSVGYRGGSWTDSCSTTLGALRASNRVHSGNRTTTRDRSYGGRGVRSVTGDSVISFNALSGLGTNIEDVFLQGMWNLQETTGTTATDSSSRARNGTITNMGSNPATAAGPNNWLTSSFNFDGTDDYVDIGSNLGMTVYPYSFVLFVRPDRFPSTYNASALSLVRLSTHDRYFSFQATATTGLAEIAARNNTHFSGVSASSLSTSSWSHAALVYESNTSKKLFINGALAATLTTSVVPDASISRLLIGRLRTLTTANSWDGLIAGVMAFNRALGKAEVNELRLGPEPINTVAPVLSGTATQGQTLSVTTGTWGLDAPFSSGSNGTIYYSYQWTRSDNNSGLNETNISGATSSSYTLAAGDVGKYIRCYVRAGNDGGYDVGPGTASGFSAVVGG
ncbi:MAG: LamG-like jellyroll fold domain-containing protein, partial [Pseudomonadota bacterium]